MNREQRRRLTKQLKGKHIILPKDSDEPPVDHKKDQWCHRHTAMKLENIDQPTERDKEKIESIRYETKKYEQEDGTILVKKVCPKCLFSFEVDVITRPLLG